MSAPQTTPQQVIARDAVASGDPRGEIVADRILAALARAGLVVVPREPTQAMLVSGGQHVYGENECRRIWARMMEAAHVE